MTNLSFLWVDFPDREPYSFGPDEVVNVGRSGQCQLCLPKDLRAISRVHARFACEGGVWYVWDRSAKGTLLDGERIPSDRPVALADGARLEIGPCVFALRLIPAAAPVAAGADRDDAFDVTVSQVDLAELDAKRVLVSALELPLRLGEACGESEVFAVACRYLVATLSPVVASAYVVLGATDGDAPPRIVAQHHCGQGASPLAGMPAPAISRRVVERVVREPDSVVFLSRRHLAAPIEATVALTTNSLGACFIELGADKRPVLLYTIGPQGVAASGALVGEYLKLVATLTRQHLLTLRRARMSKYFSPKVVEMLMQAGGGALAQGSASVVPATTLFFDLRGFSLSVEASASDLLHLQSDLSAIITLVTKVVFEAGGTVIDYQGDAVFAAWGVPFPQEDQARLAASCALQVIHRLQAADIRMLRRQRAECKTVCGIGLCCGEVLAGSVGSREMFKYGLLGPSVNISKRLESLTKPSRLNAAILCCERLARDLDAGGIRTRRVARVQLSGMAREENAYEIVDGHAVHERLWHAAHDEVWREALLTLEAARTEQDLWALEPLLDRLPADHPRSFWIRRMMLRLRNREALSQWDGVLRE